MCVKQKTKVSSIFTDHAISNYCSCNVVVTLADILRIFGLLIVLFFWPIYEYKIIFLNFSN